MRCDVMNVYTVTAIPGTHPRPCPRPCASAYAYALECRVSFHRHISIRAVKVSEISDCVLACVCACAGVLCCCRLLCHRNAFFLTNSLQKSGTKG